MAELQMDLTDYVSDILLQEGYVPLSGPDSYKSVVLVCWHMDNIIPYAIIVNTIP